VAESSVVIPVDADHVLELARHGGARATLVNVWATWCAPCRAEFPGMLRVARARAPEGLRLVLVSADFADQLPAVRKFLAEQGVRDTTYLKSGDEMKFINTLSSDWSGALPATFVFGADGRLLTYWEGEADTSEFELAADHALHSTSQKEQP
jgi:thiol-disulfide isomerase/thioredoxin